MAIFRELFIIWMLIFSLVSCKEEKDQSQKRKAHTVNDFIEELQATYPLPGIAVGIVTKDTTYFSSAGFTDVHASNLINQSTIFFAGSLSELLVTSTILKMDDDGILALTDPVVKHLPYFKMEGTSEHINIHHLLTHTSGIPIFKPVWDMPSYEANALETTTRSIVFQPLDFFPGSRCKRAPYNFDIAADLISKAGMESFENVVNTRVFKSLGMTKSSFGIIGLDTLKIARPHLVSNWLTYQLEESNQYPYTRENVGSFGLHTTVYDMAAWISMVLKVGSGERQLLSSHAINQLMGLHYQTDSSIFKGYGWDIAQSDQGLLYNNAWQIAGFSGELALFPEEQMGIIILTNTSDDFNVSVIRDHLVHLLKGGKTEKIKIPAQIAMGKQLAAGKNIEYVLQWFDSLYCQNNQDYLLTTQTLGQLGVNLMHRANRTNDALAVFRYGVGRFTEDRGAYLNLTECLIVLGKINEARKYFELAMNISGKVNNPYVDFLKEQLEVAKENEDSMICQN